MIICYTRFESFYETNDTQKNEWLSFEGSITDFKNNFPDYQIAIAFNDNPTESISALFHQFKDTTPVEITSL